MVDVVEGEAAEEVEGPALGEARLLGEGGQGAVADLAVGPAPGLGEAEDLRLRVPVPHYATRRLGARPTVAPSVRR